MSRPFLTAEWRHLVLANYAVEPALLVPYLPTGTTLDLWNGTCYLSLVGFLFKDTRLRGIPIPFHRDFEEVNLRFYVKREEAGAVKRGVVFVQEIVPKPALSWVARTIYREPYRTLPMSHVLRVRPEKKDVFASYAWRCRGQEHVLKVFGGLEPTELIEGSEAEFITEHYWGYTRIRHGVTNAYEVRHPRWRVHPVYHHGVHVDFGLVYGERFRFLNDATPISVMLAEGSPVQVMRGERLDP
ncbi:MAG: DUF2071 domain-containing protein [Flavobacteriales bacterium]|nr:DUF2071 domain-containing protein [Flavobacteriales bacterium]